MMFLPLPKSLHSGNTKAKNVKRNRSEHYRLTVKNVKWSRDTFKPINAMDFSLRYGNIYCLVINNRILLFEHILLHLNIRYKLMSVLSLFFPVH